MLCDLSTSVVCRLVLSVPQMVVRHCLLVLPLTFASTQLAYIGHMQTPMVRCTGRRTFARVARSRYFAEAPSLEEHGLYNSTVDWLQSGVGKLKLSEKRWRSFLEAPRGALRAEVAADAQRARRRYQASCVRSRLCQVFATRRLFACRRGHGR